jgi:hypothetical protein
MVMGFLFSAVRAPSAGCSNGQCLDPFQDMVERIVPDAGRDFDR